MAGRKTGDGPTNDERQIGCLGLLVRSCHRPFAPEDQGCETRTLAQHLARDVERDACVPGAEARRRAELVEPDERCHGCLLKSIVDEITRSENVTHEVGGETAVASDEHREGLLAATPDQAHELSIGREGRGVLVGHIT